MKRVSVILTAVLSLVATHAWAQDVGTVVDGATKSFLAANPQSAGMAIGIVRDGKTWFYNYGVANRDGHVPVTSDTLFPIASVTKTFTGTLLADAQLDGKLRLDDDIRKYLDGDYPNLENSGRAVHIADLVDHRSGLPFFIPDTPETRPDFKSDTPWLARVNALEQTYSRADFYADLHKVTLAGKPGEVVQYSNAGALLASYILERVYGEPYENLVKDKVLTPLGMTATTITLTPAQRTQVAVGYDGAGHVMPGDADEFLGAGALKSTARDMVKYASWEMAESDPAVVLSHQPQATAGTYAAGLNWQMMTGAEGRRVIWQSGNFDGFNSLCVTEPELKTAVVVLFNEADDASNPAHQDMVNAILKGLDDRSVPLP